MTNLAFETVKNTHPMVTCVFEEGQIVIAQRAEDEPALCWFAVTRPSTMTIEMRRAELNSRGVGTPAYRALEQMVPGLGANIGWFPTIAEGMTLLTDVAGMISETAPEDQVAQSGLTKIDGWGGVYGLYEKPIAGGTLRLALKDTRVHLVFETETTVITPFLITTQGRAGHQAVDFTMPGFLQTPARRLSVALAQARLFESARASR